MFNNKGQSLISILIVLVVVGIITGGLYLYLSNQIPELPKLTEKGGEEQIVSDEKAVEPEGEKEEEITPSPKQESPGEGTIPSEGKPIIQKCTDGTLYGQCSATKPKYCDNGNLVEKASLCGCSSNYEISNNQCVIKTVCQNECASIGFKGCSDNGYQVCGNYNNDNCLEWGPVISCPAETSCMMGNCTAITTPRNDVEYWVVTFGTAKEEDVGLLGFNQFPSVLKDILIQHGWKEDYIKYFGGENATYANVITALDWLANNAGPSDIILFYSMTHGSSAGISLHDKFLEFTELAEKFDKIKYSGLAIIIDACHSGGAIPVLKKENRVIMTSTRSDEMGVNAVFSQRVLAALQGFGDIEGNNNGWVSAREAFNFAQTRYAGPQSWPWPQIQDDYPGELNILFLDGYWRYLDQFNMEKGKSSFTGSNYLGGDPLNDEVKIYAQSFKPNYPILTKAMLGVYFGNGNPGPLTVSVRKDLSGSDLTSATLNQNVIRFSSPELYEFDFPDIEVIPNETYYLIIEPSNLGRKDDYYNLWVDNVGSYPGGSYPKGTTFFKSISPSIPWTDISPVDLYFATFGKPK